MTDISNPAQRNDGGVEREERSLSLLRYVSELVLVVEADGVVRHGSSAVGTELGYELAALFGTNILEHVHPEDEDRMSEALAGVVGDARRREPLEFRIRHADGSWRFVEGIATNLLDEPEVEGIVFNFRDVTDRVLAEKALRESEERFRSLVQHATDIITVFDAEGVISYESPSVERVLGYRPGEMVGKNAFAFVHPEDIGMVREDFAGLLNQPGVRRPIEFRIRHADGSWRSFESIANNLLGNHVVRGVVINSRDVTDRKQAEEELRQAEERFRGAFENAPIGMALVSPGGRFLRVNRSLCEIIGYSEEELLVKRFMDVTHPEDVQRGLDGAARLLAGEIRAWQMEK